LVPVLRLKVRSQYTHADPTDKVTMKYSFIASKVNLEIALLMEFN